VKDPSDEEMAAIMAAVELAWPRPVPVVADTGRDSPNRWRFSGRWWARRLPARRERRWIR
jgi:hypothetical protein